MVRLEKTVFLTALVTFAIGGPAKSQPQEENRWKCSAPIAIAAELSLPEKISETCARAASCLKEGLKDSPQLVRQNEILCGADGSLGALLSAISDRAVRAVASSAASTGQIPLRLEDVLE